MCDWNPVGGKSINAAAANNVVPGVDNTGTVFDPPALTTTAPCRTRACWWSVVETRLWSVMMVVVEDDGSRSVGNGGGLFQRAGWERGRWRVASDEMR